MGSSHGAGIALDLIENYLNVNGNDNIQVAVEMFGGVDAKAVCEYWVTTGKKSSCDEPESEFIKQSPIFRVDRINVPLLIIHGAKDKVVPVKEAYKLETELRNLGKVYDIKIYANSGHGFVYTKTVESSQARSEITKWLNKYLK